MGRRRCGDVDLDVETQLDKTGYLQERLFALLRTLCVAVKGPEQAALLDRQMMTLLRLGVSFHPSLNQCSSQLSIVAASK